MRAILAYRVSFRTVVAAKKNPVSKKPKQKQQKSKKKEKKYLKVKRDCIILRYFYFNQQSLRKEHTC